MTGKVCVVDMFGLQTQVNGGNRYSSISLAGFNSALTSAWDVIVKQRAV